MAERGQSEQYNNKPGQENREPNFVSNPRQVPEFSGTGNPLQEGDYDENPESNTQNDNGERKGTSNRGFAAMDSEKQKRIASEGGRAAHKQGVAHEWSKDEAREAGRKGGQIVSQNREHMSEIGRKGGQSSGQRRQRNTEERGSE